MAQVCAHHTTFLELGADLAFVGSGAPSMAAAFQAERCPGATVLVDPERAAYQAFALRRGVLSVFSPRSVGAAVSAFREGYRQGAVEGDALQQGGAFVIDTSGEIRFAQRSQRAGDHVDPEELIAAVQALRASGSPA